MTLVIVGIFLVLIVGGIAWTLFRPTDWAVRGVSSIMPEVLFRVDTSERAIALTIDDAPDPLVTPGLLRELRAAGAKATFFVIGSNAEAHPELLEAIRKDGHQLANHLFTDRMSASLSDEEFRQELLRTDALIGPLDAPRWCRPGSGVITPRLVRIMKEEGYAAVVGTAYPIDLYANVEVTTNQFMDNLRPGAILVIHDGGVRRQKNVEVLSDLLPRIRHMGYRLVTLTELHNLGGR